jgi:hypothetical protein
MSKDERSRNSSLSEKPVRSRPRRLVDWINSTGSPEGPFIDEPSGSYGQHRPHNPVAIDSFLGISEA